MIEPDTQDADLAYETEEKQRNMGSDNDWSENYWSANGWSGGDEEWYGAAHWHIE